MTDIKEEIIEKQTITVGKRCDYCTRKASNNQITTEGTWLDFDSSHYGWGNDSSESYNHYDVCGAACFIKLLPKCLKNVTDSAGKYYHGAEIADLPAEFCKQLLGLQKS